MDSFFIMVYNEPVYIPARREQQEQQEQLDWDLSSEYECDGEESECLSEEEPGVPIVIVTEDGEDGGDSAVEDTSSNCLVSLLTAIGNLR